MELGNEENVIELSDIPSMDIGDLANTQQADEYAGEILAPTIQPIQPGQAIEDAVPIITPETGVMDAAQLQSPISMGAETGVVEPQPVDLAAQPITTTLGNTLVEQTVPVSEQVGTNRVDSVQITPAYKDIQAQQTEAVKTVGAGAQMQIQAAEELAAEKLIIDRLRLEKSKEISDKYTLLTNQMDTEIRDAKAIADKTRDQLASEPWETFWGSKSTGDRVMLGVAVALGAYGQSKIGGQNVAMSLLTNMVDDYNQGQKLKAQVLENRLAAAQQYPGQLADVGAKQLGQLKGQLEASYAQLDNQLAILGSKAATLKTKGEIEQKRAELQSKMLGESADMEQQILSKVSRTENVMKTTDKRITNDMPYATQPDGSLKTMDTEQRKAFDATRIAAPAAKQLDEYEKKGGIQHTPEYDKLYSVLRSQDALVGLPGQTISGLEYLRFLKNRLDTLTQSNPDLRNYTRQMYAVAEQRLRKESGAALPEGEFTKKWLQFMPAPLSILKDKASRDADAVRAQEARHNQISAMHAVSGHPSKLDWELPEK